MDETKSAWASKINWGEIIKVLAMLATVKGIDIPPDVQASLLAVIIGVGAVYTWIMRTFFTTQLTHSSSPSLAIGAMLLASLMGSPQSASAADMPVIPLPVKAPASTPCTQTGCTGFYIGGGLIGSGSNMDILGSGINGSVFAGGGALDLHAGYQFWNGKFFFAGEAGCGYEIASNAQLTPGMGNQNRFLCTQMGKFGIGLAGLFGGVPTAPAAPSQTPVPITVPASIANALMSPYIQFGAIERPWGTAWASGAGAEFLLAQNWNLDLSYIHAVYGSNAVVNPAQVQKTDNLIKLGLNYKF